MARDEEERGHVAAVAGQEGDRALVALRMEGFPEGFQLSAGARVVVVSGPGGITVRPLTRVIRGRVPREAIERRGEVSVEGRRLELQDATVFDEQAPTGEPRAEDVIFVVDSRDPESPEQVLSVRSVNSERR